MIETRKTKWNIDLLICMALVLICPYYIGLEYIARYYIGTSIFLQLFRIVTILSIVRLIFLLAKKDELNGKRSKKIFSFFLPIAIVALYTFAISLGQVDFLKHRGIYYGSLSTDLLFRRGIKYIAYVLLAIYVSLVLDSWKKVYKITILLVAGLCIAEIVGLIQFIIFTLSNVNIIPIMRSSGIDDATFRTVKPTIFLFGHTWLRINSLAHEPKGFASLMVILLLFKLFWSSLRGRAYSYCKTPKYLDFYLKRTLLITILTLVLTFSSSVVLPLSILGLFLGFNVVEDIAANRSTRIRKSTVLIFSVLFISLGLYIIYPEAFVSFFYNIFSRRLSEFFLDYSLSSFQYSLDPEDGAIINNLFNYPIASITGIGFGGFSNLSIEFVASAYGTAITERVSPFSRNLFVEVIFSSGIIGIFACFSFARRILPPPSLMKDPIITIFSLVALITFIGRMLGDEALFFVFIGVLVACKLLYLGMSSDPSESV